MHKRAKVVVCALAAFGCAAAPLWAVGPREAYADGNADEADLHFQIAAEAYSKGDFRLALEHFLLSNRLVPNKNVVFNVARTYEQLRKFADAHRYYVDALDGETNQQTVSTIQDAIKRIAPNVAVLKIESDPPGATVYIDRKDLGSRGRAPKPLAIAEGKYKVIVELEGYEPATMDAVEAKIGSETKVPFALKRIVGTVAVTVEGAPNAAVHVDDEQSAPVCAAPCSFEIPPGRHLLYFSREGFQAAPRQITVVAKETIKASAVLTPLTGSVVVQADERDAIVEIDGKPAGFTPAVIQNVSVGPRKVRVTLRGYAPVERSVDIKANQQTQLLDLKLVPLRQVAAASRFTENIEDAPSSVTIIDGQELRAFGYPTIYESLRGIRGIAVGYDRVYASAAIRGIGDPNDFGNRLLVLQDGTVLNDNILSQSFIGSDGRADLDDVDRIEVVRGPGSLVYGTGAMSGVVNLVPKPKDNETSATVSGGTYDNSVVHGRAGFHANFNKEKTAGMWASVSGARSDGIDVEIQPRDPSLGQTAIGRQNDFFRSYGTAGRMWVGPVTAQWYAHSRDLHVTIGPYGTLFNDARTRYLDERVMGEIRAEPVVNDKLQFMIRGHANHYHFHGAYFYDPPPATGYDEDYDGTWFGGEARAVITPTTALRLTVGGEFQAHPEANMIACDNWEEEGNPSEPDPLLKQGSRGTCDRAEPKPDVVTEDYYDPTYLDVQQNYLAGAVYGLVDWAVAKQFRVSAGIRADFSSYIPPQPVVRGALIFKPWNGGVIKLMGGNAFRRPSIYERFYFDGGFAQVQSEDPSGQNKEPNSFLDEPLKSETIITGEVEISQRFLEDWTALGALHVNRIENLMTSVKAPEPVPDPDPETDVFQYKNSPVPSLNVGFDVELRRDWRQGWMLSAFYGFQKPQFVEIPAGDPLAINPRITNAPEHLAGVKGVVPIVPDLASLGLRFTLEAPRRVSYDSTETTRAAAVADLTLSGNVKRFGVGYVVGVFNVADVRYNLPITENYAARLSPQNGRTFLAKVSITYP